MSSRAERFQEGAQAKGECSPEVAAGVFECTYLTQDYELKVVFDTFRILRKSQAAFLDLLLLGCFLNRCSTNWE